MTRKFIGRFQSLIIVTRFVGVATILCSLTSLAQVKNASQSTAFTSSEKKLSSAVSMSAGGSLFLPPVVYDSGGVDEAGFVTAVDVNGDGIPDLLVANSYYTDTIAVFLGRGDGTFAPPTAFSTGGGFPMGIVAADLNGDGKLDLVVINQTRCYACSGDGLVAVLLGNGNGTFRSPKTYDSGGVGPPAGDLGPNPIAVVDVNGDGKLDVVVANCAPSLSSGCGDGDGAVGVLLGKGDGTFSPVVTYDSGSSPGGTGLVAADLNHDGKVDIVVTNGCVYGNNCVTGGIGVLLGNGDGTFRPSVNYALASSSASGIALADLNGDGNLDVVTGGCGSTNCFGLNGIVSVLLGKGDGTFGIATGYDSGGPLADGISVADVTGDGKLDVIAADTLTPSVAMLPGNGDGTLQPPVVFPSGASYCYSIAVADLNGDGKLDVMVTSLGDQGTVSILLNSGDFTYHRTSTALVSSKNPGSVKDTITYTATVTSSDGEAVSGVVNFVDGTSSAVAEVIENGQATYTASYKKKGDRVIVAEYEGNTTQATSSASLIEIVGKKPYPTETTLATSGSPSLAGQPVTFTATLTSIFGAIPNGEVVTFYDGKFEIGTGTTLNGMAGITTSSLSQKHHTIIAKYTGDGTFNASKGEVIQVVEK